MAGETEKRTGGQKRDRRGLRLVSLPRHQPLEAGTALDQPPGSCQGSVRDLRDDRGTELVTEHGRGMSLPHSAADRGENRPRVR